MTEISSDEAELTRLAALSSLAYDREREIAAKRLGVRISVLDEAVKDLRSDQTARAAPLPKAALPEIEPWPTSVDGGILVHEMAAAIRVHLVMEENAPEAVAFWVLQAHALDAFAFSPRLAITSAEKRCGKTTLLDVLGALVPRPLHTANATAAAIFRSIEALQPTLLIDEADTFLKHNDELRGVLNSGHRHATAHVLRLEGDDYQPRQFSTWAATAIAIIGKLPDTLADRSIEIRLRRRVASEKVLRFRADRADNLKRLARMAARWSKDHVEALRKADPAPAAGLHDRANDNWSPVLAIADIIGGEWPFKARRIALSLAAVDDETGSFGEMLLADVRQIFNDLAAGAVNMIFFSGERIIDIDRIRSTSLAQLLVRIEGRPWPEFGMKRQPINPHGIARLLKPFAIAPTTQRFRKVDKAGKETSVTEKGYLRSQFGDAWARYLPQGDTENTVTS